MNEIHERMQQQPVELIVKSFFWLRQQLSNFLYLSLGEFKVQSFLFLEFILYIFYIFNTFVSSAAISEQKFL